MNKTNEQTGPITDNMFKNFSDLDISDIQQWDTSKITNFHNITTDIKDDQYD